MSAPKTIYLITGGARGLGKGLVESFLTRPNTIVIAGVRDPTSATSSALSNSPQDSSSQLIIVKIDSKSETDPAEAISLLQSKHQITYLDTVITNAGISEDYSTVATVPPAVFKEHIAVNGYGAFFLFQAVVPLLQKSRHGAKFVGIGSPLGSIGGMKQRPYPCAAYGASKAVLHWLVRKVHFENKDIVSFVLDPGFVQTDMGNSGARAFGMKEASLPVQDSVAGIVSQVDGATREKTSGHFKVWDDTEFPW